MKGQHGNKVGFEFTIHFYYRREISQSELTKQAIKTAAERLLKFYRVRLVSRPFPAIWKVDGQAHLIKLLTTLSLSL